MVFTIVSRVELEAYVAIVVTNPDDVLLFVQQLRVR
jgi:hypothetical protein